MTTEEQMILLVEDNDDDANLTMMALHRAKIKNPLIRVRDGVEALDYLFGRGQHAGRDVSELPAVTLLDLNLPKVSGLEVLEAIRQEIREGAQKYRMADQSHCRRNRLVYKIG